MSIDTNAQAFIEAQTAALQQLEAAQATAAWRFSTHGDVPAEQVARATAALRTHFSSVSDYQTLRRFKTQTGLDAAQSRQIELLFNAFSANQIAPEVLAEIATIEASIEERFTRFRAHFDNKTVSDNDLREVLVHERDTERRRAAWLGSKEIGAEVASDVLRLVHMRNAEARRLGYRDYYAMSLATQELDEAWMFDTLAALQAQTDAPFAQLKTKLDKALRERYGMAVDAPLYPWHYADPFFQSLPQSAEGIDLDPLFAEVDSVALSRAFFGNIGMPVGDILSRSDLFEREGKQQHAFCTRLDRAGDVRILVNLRADEGWTSVLLHELGHAVYDQGIPQQLPWLLRDVSHALTTEAVALMFERMTRHGPWLRTYLGLSDAVAKRIGSQAQRALADGQLIFSRWCLVMVNFERALYADPDQDLSALWWRLVSRLQGVTPPPDTTRPDWASKIHIANTPVYYQNYIIGELVASQLWNTLLTGVVGDSNDPNAALASDKRVGEFFQREVFNPGATAQWTDHVAQATREPLNASYYARLVRGELA